MALTDVDLSTAILLADPEGADPWGKYEDGHIVTNGGYPDFRFPTMVLDRSLVYTFEVTYDPDSPYDFGDRDLWLWVGSSIDFDASYHAPYDAFDNELSSVDNRTVDGDVVTLVVPTAMWAGVPADFSTPFFETSRFGAVSRFRWSGGSFDGGGDVSSSPYLDGRAAFAS